MGGSCCNFWSVFGLYLKKLVLILFFKTISHQHQRENKVIWFDISCNSRMFAASTSINWLSSQISRGPTTVKREAMPCFQGKLNFEKWKSPLFRHLVITWFVKVKSNFPRAFNCQGERYWKLLEHIEHQKDKNCLRVDLQIIADIDLFTYHHPKNTESDSLLFNLLVFTVFWLGNGFSCNFLALFFLARGNRWKILHWNNTAQLDVNFSQRMRKFPTGWKWQWK